MSDNKGVLIIYTGGTIGSMPIDPSDDTSPQVVVGWDKFRKLTPQISKENLGFRLGFEEISESLDSCNIGPRHWSEIASIIERNYDEYEGFVILHGTDTMVYTASVLSFMLANLGKPVVLTGAQRAHLFQVRNDALQNMITSIAIANPKATRIPTIPEVMILFGNDLLRGNRSRKKDANGYEAYESPKYPNLARIGANIEVDESRILDMPEGDFYVRKSLETDVIDLNVVPSIVENGVADLLLDNIDFGPKGVVVRSYGAGNIPTDDRFLSRLTKASQNRGITLLNVTQCTKGRVELGLYETSNKLLEFGMVSGTDLTPEAALVKLMVGLADEDIAGSPTRLRNFLQNSEAGEQSTSIFEIPFSGGTADISKGNPRHRFMSDRDLPSLWDADKLESAQLRFYGAKIDGSGAKQDKPITVDIYANLSTNEDPSPRKFCVSVNKAPTKSPTILSFDVTHGTQALLAPGRPVSFTAILNGEGDLSWTSAELALFIKA